MRRLLIATTLALGACPICPDGELRVVSGTLPVTAGATVSLELRYDGLIAGPTRCGGFWYVDGVLGGDAVHGTIDPCGTYTAPATPPAAAVRVEAGRYAEDGCADCCPWGARTVPLSTP